MTTKKYARRCLSACDSSNIRVKGRRLLEGDSLWHALDVWAVNILGVTAWELRFWPFWSATQFCLVPNSLQVIFASLGSLSWNFYISFTALQEPVAHAKVRIGIKVDGVSSPLHRSPARRSVGASQMRSSPLREALRSPMILPADLDLADELVDAAESMAYGRRYKMQQSATGCSLSLSFSACAEPLRSSHFSSSSTIPFLSCYTTPQNPALLCPVSAHHNQPNACSSSLEIRPLCCSGSKLGAEHDWLLTGDRITLQRTPAPSSAPAQSWRHQIQFNSLEFNTECTVNDTTRTNSRKPNDIAKGVLPCWGRFSPPLAAHPVRRTGCPISIS